MLNIIKVLQCLLLLTVRIQSVWAKSETFNLIAIGNDVKSAIQLYPLTIVNNSLVVSRKGEQLKYQIDDDGKTVIKGTNYKLILDNKNHLTANTTGTAVFYIAGKHLHYNGKFVFIGCPKGESNETFTVYASTDTSLCDDSVLFTLRPQLNGTDDISSYIPSALGSSTASYDSNSGSGSSALGGATTGINSQIEATGAIKSSSSTDAVAGGALTSIRGASSTGNSEADILTTLNDGVVVETVYVSTRVSTSADDSVITETIIVENQQTIISRKSHATMFVTSTNGDDGDNNIVTITTEVYGTAVGGDDNTATQPATLLTNQRVSSSSTPFAGASLTAELSDAQGLLSKGATSANIGGGYLSGVRQTSSLATGTVLTDSATLANNNQSYTRTRNFGTSKSVASPVIMFLSLISMLTF